METSHKESQPEIPKSPEAVECVICGTGFEMEFLTSGSYTRQGFDGLKYSLYECGNCKLITTYPPPNNLVYTPSRNESDEFVGLEDWEWNQKVLDLITSYKSGGDFLDIGCNSGNLMELAKSIGFQVEGVEMDEVAAREAISKKRNIRQGDFLKMEFPHQYDVIVMNHVLEHIPELDQVPQKLSELLKEDGHVFINVPNIHGWIAQIMGEKWCTLAPHEHIWFFSNQSVSKLFGNYFSKITIKTNTDTEPNGFMMWNTKTNIKTLLIKLSNLLNQGDEMRIILQK